MTFPQLPFITCITPTTPGRRKFLDQAIESFYAQDYPNKDLMIVDAPGATVGAKRNMAVGMAIGDIICHWDDDDLYAPDRLSHQAAPIVAGEADITGMPIERVRDLLSDPPQEWWCPPRLASDLFELGVHGGTLMYRRSIWLTGIRFQDTSSGEDGGWLRDALRAGYRMRPVTNNGRFTYVRHDPTNDWPLERVRAEGVRVNG